MLLQICSCFTKKNRRANSGLSYDDVSEKIATFLRGCNNMMLARSGRHEIISMNEFLLSTMLLCSTAKVGIYLLKSIRLCNFQKMLSRFARNRKNRVQQQDACSVG